MINLELAIFLGAVLGVATGTLIFLIWKRLKNHGLGTWKQSATIIISTGLLLTFVGSSLLESYRAPIEVKVSYQMGSPMEPAVSNLIDPLVADLLEPAVANLEGSGVKRMEITRTSAGLGLFGRPVYKKQLILGAITLALLLVLNSEQVKSRLGKKELAFVGNGNQKGSYKPLNVDSGLILNKLEVAMKERKLYVDPSLNLDSLSSEMDVSRYHLSQIMNEELDKNFYDLVNGYRVREAIRLIKEPGFDTTNLLRLGFEVGFNSKASFYRAFKKITGTTPAAYRDSVKQC